MLEACDELRDNEDEFLTDNRAHSNNDDFLRCRANYFMSTRQVPDLISST
jgi:hypothetical protein